MKIIALTFFLFIFITIAHADGTNIPVGWRLPSHEETKDELIKWREEDPNKYLFVEADFNGDGKTDKAQLLVSDKDNKMGLFAFISNNNSFETIKLEEFDGKVWVGVMGISVVKPGSHKTACGKGYFECEPNEPEVIELKHPAINFFKFASANSYFYWELETHSFRKIWISD